MTAKGTGAIATVQLFGTGAEDILKKIFKPAGKKSQSFKQGLILLGTITDADKTIDQVIIGCEGPKNFAINCHGNPLIVSDIMQLLDKHGAKPITSQQLLCKILSAEKLTSIEIEARLAQIKAKTLQGTKIIINQIDTDTGLKKTAENWLNNIETVSLDQIKSAAEQILIKSPTAKLIISGCKIIITGPPNTGKSTLLNYLAGRQKAIVTPAKGTTRDYVTAQCRIDPLYVELVDTAGLDEKLAAEYQNEVDKIAQQKALQLIDDADLLLLVLDRSLPIQQLDKKVLEKIAGKKILTILNKSDLPAKLNTDKLPKSLSNKVSISAKDGAGIENLRVKVHWLLAVDTFDLNQPICFTTRQKNFLTKLTKAKSKKLAVTIITELLNGKLRV